MVLFLLFLQQVVNRYVVKMRKNIKNFRRRDLNQAQFTEIIGVNPSVLVIL